MIQMTKKKDCPAVITVREYQVFPQYGLKEENFQTLSGFAQHNLRASKLKEFSRAFPNALLSGAAPRNSNYTKNIFFNKKFLISSD